jgi:FkbM family methyltransferase
MLSFPEGIKKLIINVGSNLDPPMPPDDDSSVGVIAVEPILATASGIPHHDRLFVIAAALSNEHGFATMTVHNHEGVSSSLHKPADNTTNWVYKPDKYESVQFVPVLTLKHLLDAIPSEIEVTFLKTDMQGSDYSALKSAGSSLRRVARIQSEVWCNGEQSYVGAENDYSMFETLMHRAHFRAENTPCGGGWKGESDGVWERMVHDSGHSDGKFV